MGPHLIGEVSKTKGQLSEQDVTPTSYQTLSEFEPKLLEKRNLSILELMKDSFRLDKVKFSLLRCKSVN